jgi:putative ABC transport system ATP-binding protein
MEIMIETKGVGRSFPIAGQEPFQALRDISISVPKGKLTILKGKSGSGKTTLLNILSALDRPTTGKVLIAGEDIYQQSDRRLEQLRRRSMGFVFQSVALLPTMNAYENVDFSLRMAGIKSGRQELAEAALKAVGLANRMDHMPQELSGGEQQRVAIARAIAYRPHVIFADEPTAALDTNTKLQVVKMFKDLSESEGLTFVMTTHDLGIMDLGDVVYELKDGELVHE